MKNNTTFTLTFSHNAIKQEITALCAWIDICNISILPPIINPATGNNAEIEQFITECSNEIITKLAGYISSHNYDGDIITFNFKCPALSPIKVNGLSKAIEKYFVSYTLSQLYAPQPQAKHIIEEYISKQKGALTSIRHFFACAQ